MNLRPATMDDAETLLAWRNDPLTRAMSQSLAIVELSSHLAWMDQRLSRVDPGLYIAEDGEELVGTVRIDGDEISYTVAPEHRGKGVSTVMLVEARQKFGSKRARIKRDNLASRRAAENAGHSVVLID